MTLMVIYFMYYNNISTFAKSSFCAGGASDIKFPSNLFAENNMDDIW